MVRCAVCDFLDRPGSMSFSGRIRVKEGGFRKVEWRLKLIRSTPYDNDGILFIGHDVTEERRLEFELSERAEELARSNAELNQFAYVASHDLQEPLRMVLSYLGLLERRYGDKFEGDGRIYLNYAVDGAHRMKALITDLLAYSRVGSTERHFDEVNMNEALSTAMNDLKMAIASTGAVIEVEGLPTIKADRTQMVQLLQNLVGNAIKYHGEKKPVVRIASVSDNGGWTFSVQDNGIGIAQGQHEKIFEMFHRLHLREEYEGTGIGLAIAKRIVQRHGGRIWVESKEGEGSTFYFTIPRRN